jgi:hypothetical protein
VSAGLNKAWSDAADEAEAGRPYALLQLLLGARMPHPRSDWFHRQVERCGIRLVFEGPLTPLPDDFELRLRIVCALMNSHYPKGEPLRKLATRQYICGAKPALRADEAAALARSPNLRRAFRAGGEDVLDEIAACYGVAPETLRKHVSRHRAR